MNQEQKERLAGIAKIFKGNGIEVICDNTNNTPEDVENNVIHITVNCPRVVKLIDINAVVPRQE